MELNSSLTFLLILLSSLNFTSAKQKVDGTAISIEDAPYMVHVSYYTTPPGEPGYITYHKCGGTILNRQYILTAGHCKLNFS